MRYQSLKSSVHHCMYSLTHYLPLYLDGLSCYHAVKETILIAIGIARYVCMYSPTHYLPLYLDAISCYHAVKQTILIAIGIARYVCMYSPTHYLPLYLDALSCYHAVKQTILIAIGIARYVFTNTLSPFISRWTILLSCCKRDNTHSQWYLFWLFKSQSTLFQSCQAGSSLVEPVLSRGKIVLLKDTMQCLCNPSI